MKQFILASFLIIFLVMACEKTPSEAPYTHNAGIEGTVSFEEAETDSIQAHVQIINQEYGLVIDGTYSDAAGEYAFKALPPAIYQLSFFADGYEDVNRRNISLESNQTVTMSHVAMSLIQPIEFREIIIDGSLDEWEYPLYVNTNDSNWASTNDFKFLYLARDNENLYIALDVTCQEDNNSINLYLDIDYGSNTGFSDFTSIGNDFADGRLYKEVTTPSGFGADVGLCIWDGTNRFVFDLQTGEDLNANIVRQDSILEVAISFASIYSTGIPPENGQISLVALIGGGEANSMANDTIPQQSESFGDDGSRHFSTVFTRPY